MTLSVLERELLTIPETASRLRVSEKTVRRLVRAGILPAVRVSAGAIRIEADELDDWLDERRTHQDAGASSSSRPADPCRARPRPGGVGSSHRRGNDDLLDRQRRPGRATTGE
jgi:excisionase family DNA binding protein